jgi:hypothetical protein
MEEALRTVKLPKREKKVPASGAAPYCLPPGCSMDGFLIRQRLQALADSCANDRACLEAGLQQLGEDLKKGKVPWASPNG